MRTPITLLDRLQQAGILLLFAGLVLWVGLLLLRAIGRSSPARYRHGKFVLAWMVGGWLVGAAIGVWIIDNDHYYPNEADAGMAGFGLLVGWVVGTIHGVIVLAVSPSKTAAAETSPPVG